MVNRTLAEQQEHRAQFWKNENDKKERLISELKMENTNPELQAMYDELLGRYDLENEILTELFNIYKWRKVIAEDEAAGLSGNRLKKVLASYGHRKKRAWERVAEILK